MPLGNKSSLERKRQRGVPTLMTLLTMLIFNI